VLEKSSYFIEEVKFLVSSKWQREEKQTRKPQEHEGENKKNARSCKHSNPFYGLFHLDDNQIKELNNFLYSLGVVLAIGTRKMSHEEAKFAGDKSSKNLAYRYLSSKENKPRLSDKTFCSIISSCTVNVIIEMKQALSKLPQRETDLYEFSKEFGKGTWNAKILKEKLVAIEPGKALFLHSSTLHNHSPSDFCSSRGNEGNALPEIQVSLSFWEMPHKNKGIGKGTTEIASQFCNYLRSKRKTSPSSPG
jgi:hypothetical protein